MVNFLPSAGDLVWLDFDPQAGHEQSGVRPALVISPAAYNQKTGLAIFCPVTNQSKNYPFEVSVPKKTGIAGVILADHVKSLDWRARNAKFIAKLPPKNFQEVQEKLSLLLVGSSN